jgi:hypothetical protein
VPAACVLSETIEKARAGCSPLRTEIAARMTRHLNNKSHLIECERSTFAARHRINLKRKT